MQKNAKTNAAEGKKKKFGFFSSVINCLEYEAFQSRWITVSDY